ncbi:unnamed protein product [Camellia sinensis]
MHFHPPTTFSLYSTLSRHFSSTTKLPKLSKIPSRYRPKAIHLAQKALTDYLHTTRSLPFIYAEHISKNALFSLSDVASKVHFSLPQLSSNPFRGSSGTTLSTNLNFSMRVLALIIMKLMGFCPPTSFSYLRIRGLGELYREEISIFSKNPSELSRKLHGFKDYGFGSVTVIGIGLVFPYVLNGETELGNEISALFDDLGKLFADFDLLNCVEGNVDAWIEVCRKIKVFYDLGCEKGKMGELMGKRKSIFLEYPEEVLVNKVEFFCRLSVNKSDVGLLILERPKILDFDLEDQMISVLGLLKHFGMNTKELKSISEKYPYVLGRHKMVNLPHVMRALDLQEWFFNKMGSGKHHLLCTCVVGNEDLDKDYKGSLDIIQSSRTSIHTLQK